VFLQEHICVFAKVFLQEHFSTQMYIQSGTTSNKPLVCFRLEGAEMLTSAPKKTRSSKLLIAKELRIRILRRIKSFNHEGH